jgi:hypothetical protein
VRADATALRASAFLREPFAGPFLDGIPTDPTRGARELYTVYLLWRFAVVNRRE